MCFLCLMLIDTSDSSFVSQVKLDANDPEANGILTKEAQTGTFQHFGKILNQEVSTRCLLSVRSSLLNYHLIV